MQYGQYRASSQLAAWQGLAGRTSGSLPPLKPCCLGKMFVICCCKWMELRAPLCAGKASSVPRRADPGLGQELISPHRDLCVPLQQWLWRTGTGPGCNRATACGHTRSLLCPPPEPKHLEQTELMPQVRGPSGCFMETSGQALGDGAGLARGNRLQRRADPCGDTSKASAIPATSSSHPRGASAPAPVLPADPRRERALIPHLPKVGRKDGKLHTSVSGKLPGHLRCILPLHPRAFSPTSRSSLRCHHKGISGSKEVNASGRRRRGRGKRFP